MTSERDARYQRDLADAQSQVSFGYGLGVAFVAASVSALIAISGIGKIDQLFNLMAIFATLFVGGFVLIIITWRWQKVRLNRLYHEYLRDTGNSL